tara:strand:- start:433 stop:747 length:315 start_codon:yes stop_codon:yes gene_type:complete
MLNNTHKLSAIAVWGVMGEPYASSHRYYCKCTAKHCEKAIPNLKQNYYYDYSILHRYADDDSKPMWEHVWKRTHLRRESGTGVVQFIPEEHTFWEVDEGQYARL